jgi:hypothetical protein
MCEKFHAEEKNSCASEQFFMSRLPYIYLHMPVVHNQKTTMSLILFTRMDQCETVAVFKPSVLVLFTY